MYTKFWKNGQHHVLRIRVGAHLSLEPGFYHADGMIISWTKWQLFIQLNIYNIWKRQFETKILPYKYISFSEHAVYKLKVITYNIFF